MLKSFVTFGALNIVVVILAIGVTASGRQSRWAPDGDPVSKRLVEMERRWAESTCDHNLDAQKFLADDFQGTAPDGSRYDKSKEVGDIGSSKSTGRDCRLGDVTVHFFGDNLAILYGSESWTEKGLSGKDRRRTLIWTDTWFKRNGLWQIISAQDSWHDQK